MRLFFALIIWLFGQQLFAQQQQSISGTVEDRYTHSGLAAINITLTGRDSLNRVTTTDEKGSFTFSRVVPGRYILQASSVGYESAQQEIIVISARPTDILFSLQEFQHTLDEVEIKGTRAETFIPGEQVISAEKTLRLPANFFDPVRVVTSYPGVMTANDQNNTIVIRGNSPAGLLWRINGLDVVNPNHLANAGTFSDKPAAYGGGVNIISSQLMRETNFYTGSIPVQYGNALSGVVDMNLRSGDTTNYRYTAQASLIGVDLAAEGPLGKKRTTSFLTNYRYSTVGLLSALGVKFGDEDIRFQDLTFALNSTFDKGGKLSWFGFYGSSKNQFEHKPEDEVLTDKDRYDITYASKNYGTGFTYSKSLKSVLNISAGLSVSGNNQKRQQQASPEVDPGLTYIIYDDQLKVNKVLVSAFGRLRAKIDNYQLETGFQINYQNDYLWFSNTSQNGNLTFEAKQSAILYGLLLQPYAQWKILISDKWSAQTAVRYVYYTYNETGAVEPRVQLEFLPTVSGSFKFSYNLVSQVQQSATYFNFGNRDLQLSKAHHFDLGYAYATATGFRFSATAYYQQLFDIPVSQTFPAYSLLNSIEAYALPGLVSEGTGRNFGLEVVTEKKFVNKSYLIGGVSYYRSQYKGFDRVLRSTRFDGNYTVNVTYGREWGKTRKQSYRVFGVSSRVLYLGGLRESPLVADPAFPGTVYDESRAFENKLNDYFRMDLRLSWRKNKNRYTRTLAIDIQNILNVKNQAYRYYDHVKSAVTMQYQLGLLPVLVYRIDF